MGSYSISHEWNEEPDYESFARSMLDLLLHLEAEGVLEDVLATAPTTTKHADLDQDGDHEEAA